MHLKAQKVFKKSYSLFVRLLLVLGISSLFVTGLQENILAASNNTSQFQGKVIVKSSGNNLTASNPACVINSSADTCAFKIGYYSAASGGTLIYSETFTGVELGDFEGIFTLPLGTGTRTAGTETDYTNIFVNNDNVYLNIDFDSTGNATFVTPESFTTDGTNRMQLRGSAFSIVASKLSATNEQFIKNQAGVQSGATFNISGNGTVGGNFLADATDNTLFVDSTNNKVGIGTATPAGFFSVGASSQFQISSTGAITAATGITSSGSITFSGLANGLIKADANGLLSIATAGVDFEKALTFSGPLVRTGDTISLTAADATHNGYLSSTDFSKIQDAILSSGISGGQVLAGSTSTNSGLTFKSTTGIGTTGADIIFQTGNNGGTEAMRILNSGNIAIGSASSSAKLTIAGTADTAQLIVKGFSTQTSNIQEWQNSAGNVLGTMNNTGGLGLGTSGTTQGTLSLSGATSGTVNLTSSAAAGSWTLTLPTSAGTDGYVLKTNGSGLTTWVANSSMTLGSSIGGSPTTGSVLFVNTSGQLAQNNSDFFWDQTNSRLGIGTTSPLAKFTTFQTTAGSPATSGSSDANVAVRFAVGSTALDFGTASSGTSWIQNRLYNDFSTNYDLALQPNGGNVGVGTLSPGVALHVNSTADTDVFRLQDSDGTCSANPEAGSVTWTCSSDARLKSNIVIATPILADMLEVQVRNYTVNASGDSMTGVIAQEMISKFPNMVVQGADGFLQVREFSSWQLLQAVQETNIRINETNNVSLNLTNSVHELEKAFTLNNTDNTTLTPIQFNTLMVESIKELSNKYNTFSGFNSLSIDKNGDLTTTKNLKVEGLSAISANIISIDTSNISAVNIDVTGLLKTNQILAANISALPGGNLDIKLADITGNSAFSIFNTDNTQVFSVSSTGNVQVAGKFTFNTNTTDASVGTAVFATGETEVIIRTTASTANSKVFVSVNDDTTYAFPITKVISKTDGSFTVILNSTLDHDISFDWWVIN